MFALDLQKEYKGIVLASAIGLAAYFLSLFLPSALNSILLALLFGMIVGNFVNLPSTFQTGISFTSSKLLEFSVLFLAFSINYLQIAALGAKSFSIIAVMVVSMLLMTYYLAIKFKCPGASGWLIGFGTTICGSSAIASLAPGITKNKDDVAISMAVVNLYGSIGMILMPFLLSKFDLSATQMGLIIGGTLHSVGNVAGSGYSINNEVGLAAITFKLARVALLSPALIFFNYLVNKNNVRTLKEVFILPWYLWGFMGITVLSSFVSFPSGFISTMETIGKIILTIALAAIGLKVSFKKLYQSGRKGVLFGLVIFVLQISVVAVLMVLLSDSVIV